MGVDRPRSKPWTWRLEARPPGGMSNLQVSRDGIDIPMVMKTLRRAAAIARSPWSD
jgi:hypothetical protein